MSKRTPLYVGGGIALLLLVIVAVVLVNRGTGKKDSNGSASAKPTPPSAPSVDGIESSLNPGLIITFTPSESAGVGASSYSSFKMYLAPSTDTNDPPSLTYIIDIPNNKITTGNDGPDCGNELLRWSWIDGDGSTPGEQTKIKISKCSISDLTPGTPYKIGIKSANNVLPDEYSPIAWSSDSITYDMCQKDPSHCWASASPPEATGGTASGSLCYTDLPEELVTAGQNQDPCIPNDGANPDFTYSYMYSETANGCQTLGCVPSGCSNNDKVFVNGQCVDKLKDSGNDTINFNDHVRFENLYLVTSPLVSLVTTDKSIIPESSISGGYTTNLFKIIPVGDKSGPIGASLLFSQEVRLQSYPFGKFVGVQDNGTDLRSYDTDTSDKTIWDVAVVPIPGGTRKVLKKDNVQIHLTSADLTIDNDVIPESYNPLSFSYYDFQGKNRHCGGDNISTVTNQMTNETYNYGDTITIDKCKMFCSNRYNCSGMVYNPQVNRCYLKSAASTSTVNKDQTNKSVQGNLCYLR